MRGDGKDGHTLRRIWWNQNEVVARRGLAWVCTLDRHRQTHACGVVELAVSSVDRMIPNAENQSRYGHNVNLNKNGLWESVAAELEATCISKETHIPARDDKTARNLLVYHRYTVPVIGHQVFVPVMPDERFDCGGGTLVGADSDQRGKFYDSAAIEVSAADLRRRAAALAAVRDPKQFFFWRGGMYDAGLLYCISKYKTADGDSDCTLTAMGRVAPPPPPEELALECLYRADYTRLSRICTFRGGHRAGARHHFRKAQDGGADWIEIELLRPWHITHIGIAGALPPHEDFGGVRVGTRVVRYRKRMSVGNQRIDGALRASGDFARNIKVVQKDQVHNTAWVTKLTVQYRAVNGGREWVDLVTAPGNCDAYSEVLIDLTPTHLTSATGLECCQIRMRPAEWHNRPDMRLSIYGRASSAQANDHTIVYMLSEPLSERRAKIRRIHDSPVTRQCRNHAVARRKKATKWVALERQIRDEEEQWQEEQDRESRR